MMAAAAAGQILKAAGGGRLDSPLVLRHDKDTGVVRLFRLDAAMGAVLLLLLDAAICAAVLRLVVVDAITGAFVLLNGGREGPSASGPIPDGFRLDIAAAVHVRLDTAANEVVPVHLAVRTGAVLLLRVDAATGAVLPLRLAVDADAVPPLYLVAAADAGQPLRLIQPVHDDSGGVAPCRGSVPSLCHGSGSWTPKATKKATGPNKTKTSVRKRVTVPRRVGKKGVRMLVQGPLIQCQYQGGKASKGNTKLVRLKSILGDFVWFAVPIVLVFYPRKVEEEVPKSNLQLSWTWSELFHTNDLEKPTTMILFVIFLSIWIIGYLLASLGKGKQCTKAVANLTLTTVLSVIALVDYGLYKSMASSYMALFCAHFIVMAFSITLIWLKYIYGQESGVLSAIKGCRCWRLHRSQPAALSDHTAGLQEPLLRGPDMV